MFKFSERDLEILEERGWSAARTCITADKWVESLKAEGHFISDIAIKIMRSFGGLRIKSLDVKQQLPGYAIDIIFNPSTIFGDFDRMSTWEAWTGAQLTPIGESEYAVIMCDGNGGLYYCNWFWEENEFSFKIGDSFESSIHNILFREQSWTKFRQYDIDD